VTRIVKFAVVAAQEARTPPLTDPLTLTLRPETVTPLTVALELPLTVTLKVLAA
jgi:hypothetical protein